MNDNEKQFKDFVRNIKLDDTPDPEHRDKLEQNLLCAMAKQPRQVKIWRIIMKSQITKLATAAVIAIIVLGGVTFWPSGSSGNGQWWLGPPAAWGQDIIDSLEKIEALVYRQRSASVRDFGSMQMSKGWEKRYNAKDRYRRDRYDDGINIMNIQWVIPDGNDFMMVEVSLEYKCYFERKNERYGFVQNPVEDMRSYVRLLDRADRILGTKEFDGQQCIGFEVSAGKYGDNPDGRFDRIWFDLKTKLPVRIERHGLRYGFDAGRSLTIIHDQFEYYAKVPVDLFEPQIPEGFVNAHSDEVRAAKDKEKKGEMVYADVSVGLKDEIITALRNVETASYHDVASRICFSKNAWRKDHFSDEQLQRNEWYIFDKVDISETNFDVDEKVTGLTQINVNPLSNTYQVLSYNDDSQSRHPMNRILFLAGIIDRADRVLENEKIEGIECLGFEISAKKYGDNPDHMKHRLWFDVKTKLPVRMEFQSLYDNVLRTEIKNHFKWNPELPADTFIPKIPKDYELVNSNDK
jgi:outer membrane lipoprotein-sorting protein